MTSAWHCKVSPRVLSIPRIARKNKFKFSTGSELTIDHPNIQLKGTNNRMVDLELNKPKIMYQKNKTQVHCELAAGTQRCKSTDSTSAEILKTQQMPETAAYYCQFWLCCESPYANKWCVQRINFYNTNVFISGFRIEYIYICTWLCNVYIYIWVYNKYIYIYIHFKMFASWSARTFVFRRIQFNLLQIAWKQGQL